MMSVLGCWVCAAHLASSKNAGLQCCYLDGASSAACLVGLETYFYILLRVA